MTKVLKLLLPVVGEMGGTDGTDRCLETEHWIERNVGIEVYSSSTPGTGGKIKERPEDFVVEEVARIKLSDEGSFTVIRVKKVNWDTLNFVRVLAKKLKISQRRIEYAGTKDKRAVSIQYFSIYGLSDEQVEGLRNVRIRDVEIEILGKSRSRISLGDLLGNKFFVRVRGADSTPVPETLRELEERGIPNFFGLQRFGTMRFITHRVGLEILRGNYEEAFWIYVAMPFEGENEEIREVRRELWETRDPIIGLREFPNYLRYEKILLQALREGKSEEEALLMLPKNLKLMFIHAYQSYVFNRTLSERIREFETLRYVEEDDVVGFFDSHGIKEEFSPIEWRMKRVKFLMSVRRCALALPLPGYGSELRGWAGEVVKEILSEDGIGLENFRQEHKEFSSKGGYRLAEMPFSEFEYEVEGVEADRGANGKENVKFRFFLPKGSYATVFLREFTKSCLM